MQSTIVVGGKPFYGVSRGWDTNSYMATKLASVAAKEFPSAAIARVHRIDGLVITNLAALHDSTAENVNGIHFQSALCGYSGSGTQATAEILEIFGFGRSDEIFKQISSQDESAVFDFVRK